MSWKQLLYYICLFFCIETYEQEFRQGLLISHFCHNYSHTPLYMKQPHTSLLGMEPRIPHLLPRLSLPGVQMFERWSLFCYIQTDLEKFLLLHIVSRCPVKKATDTEVVMKVCLVKINGVSCLFEKQVPRHLWVSTRDTLLHCLSVLACVGGGLCGKNQPNQRAERTKAERQTGCRDRRQHVSALTLTSELYLLCFG